MKTAIRGVDYTGVAVAFICHDSVGRVAAHKRGPACRDEVGTWDTGSGSLEFGESPHEAVLREVGQEYGLDTSPDKFSATLVSTHSVVREATPDDARSHWIVFVFGCRVLTPETPVLCPLPEEQDHVVSPLWIYPDNLKSLRCHSQVAPHLQELSDKFYAPSEQALMAAGATAERARWFDIARVEVSDIAPWLDEHLAAQSLRAE